MALGGGFGHPTRPKKNKKNKKKTKNKKKKKKKLKKKWFEGLTLGDGLTTLRLAMGDGGGSNHSFSFIFFNFFLNSFIFKFY